MNEMMMQGLINALEDATASLELHAATLRNNAKAGHTYALNKTADEIERNCKAYRSVIRQAKA